MRGTYVTCAFSGKICYSEREAGLVINGCKKHFHVGGNHWAKRVHGNSKSIPRRKYYCKDCGYYHVTHTVLYTRDSRNYAWEEIFYREHERRVRREAR